MLSFDQCMLLEKCSLTLLLTSVFMRQHDMRQLVVFEKFALIALVASIVFRNYYDIKQAP